MLCGVLLAVVTWVCSCGGEASCCVERCIELTSFRSAPPPFFLRYGFVLPGNRNAAVAFHPEDVLPLNPQYDPLYAVKMAVLGKVLGKGKSRR